MEKISQYKLNLSQLKHDVAFLARNGEKLSLYEAFLNELRILTSSGDAPKGFDKYFKPPKSTSEKEETKSDNPEAPKKASPPPSSSSSKSTSDSKPPPDWNFGMFGPQHSPKGKEGKGRPIGSEQNPDQSKMILYGALGFIGFVAALTLFELGYKEISWKDFTNK